VPSTSISEPCRKNGVSGFSALELLIGLALTVCLALTICPLWTQMNMAAASRTDLSVAMVQSRVAIARLERDLRLCSAAKCRFAIPGPIVEASESQVVFLEPAGPGEAPLLVEWELTGGALMRRWGACPAARPATFGHSLYVDHKTMLEQLEAGSTLGYVIDGLTVAGPVSASALASVEAVILDARVKIVGGPGAVVMGSVARVGR
jgi:competence protein ComGC